MIEQMRDSGDQLGFKASGEITKEDVKHIEPQIEIALSNAHKHPIGMLLDLTEVKDAEWKARWEELRFLHKYGERIARVAIIGARAWEQLMADIAGATVLMQADIRYFHPEELAHAWHWAKTAKFADEVPVRQLLPPGHLMSGYNPEYTDL